MRVFTGGLVVKRRLADAALMEMRLNEESNRMNTIREDMWTAGLYRTCTGMCTQKGVFVDISRERVPENGILGTYRTAGVDGIKPLFADLERVA